MFCLFKKRWPNSLANDVLPLSNTEVRTKIFFFSKMLSIYFKTSLDCFELRIIYGAINAMMGLEVEITGNELLSRFGNFEINRNDAITFFFINCIFIFWFSQLFFLTFWFLQLFFF